jgi:uroporphyrinogen decarboxylase
MRQAGRYQPSYRRLREKVAFFELCRQPELAAQVTVTAVEELGVDAGIIFSDILVPVAEMGSAVELTEKGPRIAEPIRSATQIEQLRVFDPHEELDYVLEAIRQTVAALDGQVPLIGFAGAPLTLASYLVEGGQSRNFTHLKRMLFADPSAAHVLLDKLATVVTRHLQAQIDAGCEAVQLFDSWAGILSPEDYRAFSLPYLRRIFAELSSSGAPRIVFGTSTSALLDQFVESGADVIGVDWRIGLDQVRQHLGPDVVLQGNLDPCCLLMEEAELEQRIARVLEQAGDAPGYVFNLGHGVVPETDPARARFLVDAVHRLSKQ